MRLGEHQLSTKEDCRYIRGRSRCTTYEEFGIEDIKTDENHDIALLRLSRDVIIKRKWTTARKFQHIRDILKMSSLYFYSSHCTRLFAPE